jgi:sterol desaturase/sphingolipid hydroxylase (fatty acid hydroxylase superfamily)
VNLIALAIPLFFLGMGLELYLAHRRGLKRIYRLADSATDLSCGILSQLGGLFSTLVVVWAYNCVWVNWRIWNGATALQPVTWVLCFLGVDLGYYWFHRVSHECAIAWGTHIVHHQSEDYNLAVALRQDVLQPLLSTWFYLPMAFLGFPVAMYATCSALNTLYQFWIHTQLVDRLGPLEWVMNTPSHHRVHHGSDAKYLDRNYAGTFIIWDRFFGSFKAEEERPSFGVTDPLCSWNPLWAHVHYYRSLARKVGRAPGWANKVQVVFRGPGWVWPGADAKERHLGQPGARYDVKAPVGLGAYVSVHYVLTLALTTYLLFTAVQMPLEHRLGMVGFLTWSVLCFGGLFEGRRWALHAERLRALCPMALALVMGAGPAAVLACVLWCAVNVAFLERHCAHFGSPAEQVLKAA